MLAWHCLASASSRFPQRGMIAQGSSAGGAQHQSSKNACLIPCISLFGSGLYSCSVPSAEASVTAVDASPTTVGGQLTVVDG